MSSRSAWRLIQDCRLQGSGDICDHEQSRSCFGGEAFFLGNVDMPANVGTYLDPLFHRFPDREDLSQLPLGRLIGIERVVLDATGEQPRRFERFTRGQGRSDPHLMGFTVNRRLLRGRGFVTEDLRPSWSTRALG
jgi:hypothetical protein